MSHFSVGVFTDGKTSLEDLLIRYCEDTELVPKAYLMFKDETENLKKRLIEDKVKCIHMNDTYYLMGSEEAEACYENSSKLKEGCVIEEVPVSKVYKNIDELAKYYDYTWNEEKGCWGYWYNPEAKWDWYSEGGRFADSLFSISEDDYVDSAEVRDIDFDRMLVDCKEERKQHYEKLRGYYESLSSEQKEVGLGGYYKGIIESYPTAEEYANANASDFSTYAVVTPDGVWHAPGEVGFWGMSTDTEEESKKWHEEYADRFLKEAKEKNWCLTIIDCHI